MIATWRRVSAEALPERIAFLGLGLIGGSVALAIREAGARSTLTAWTPEGRGPAEALRRGIVDEASPTAKAAIEGAGLVVLAGPPLAIIDLLSSLAGEWRGALGEGATITDVASTKALIVENADAYGLPFVGGHPMAGRETTGVEAAAPDLFVDRPWVVVPAGSAAPDDVAHVERLAAATGARVVRLAADEHDVAVAAISHLPLVVAAALVESVAGPASNAAATWATARQLAASGWRDMTRLAKGDPEMGAGILATNAGPVTERLRALRTVLDAWIDRLDPGLGAGGDPAWLKAELEAARAALQRGPTE